MSINFQSVSFSWRVQAQSITHKLPCSPRYFWTLFSPNMKFPLSHLLLCAKYCALLLIERGSIRTFPTWNYPIPLELHKTFLICPKPIWKTPFSFMFCLMTVIKTAIFLFHDPQNLVDASIKVLCRVYISSFPIINFFKKVIIYSFYSAHPFVKNIFFVLTELKSAVSYFY